MKDDIGYVKEKFGTAVVHMTGPEDFSRRVAKAWVEIYPVTAESFEDRELRTDFEWLQSKLNQFGVGDREKARATDAECDEVRKRILKIHALLE
jgi:hypothetical protein